MPRQRDILPIPGFVGEPHDKSVSLSRSVRRRVERAVHKLAWRIGKVHTLNRLGGHGLLEPDPASKLSHGTLAAVEHISRCFNELGSPPADILSLNLATTAMCGPTFCLAT